MNYHHLAPRRIGPAAFPSKAYQTLPHITRHRLFSPVVPSPSQLSKPQLPPPIQTLHSSLLAVPAPLRCFSYILPRCSGPRWPPYQLYLTRCPRSLTVPARTFVHRLPGSQNVYVVHLARLLHSSDANTHCQHQARYIVLGCGSFVRGIHQYNLPSIPIVYIPNPFST